jgi:hypothetical protein
MIVVVGADKASWLRRRRRDVEESITRASVCKQKPSVTMERDYGMHLCKDEGWRGGVNDGIRCQHAMVVASFGRRRLGGVGGGRQVQKNFEERPKYKRTAWNDHGVQKNDKELRQESS